MWMNDGGLLLDKLNRDSIYAIILCFKNLLITFYEEVPLNCSSFFPTGPFLV